MNLWRLAGMIDRDILIDWVNQPREPRSIGDPLKHLGLKLLEIIAGRTEFDDEVGTDRGKALLIAITESLPAMTLDPGGVGTEHRTVRQSEARV